VTPPRPEGTDLGQSAAAPPLDPGFLRTAAQGRRTVGRIGQSAAEALQTRARTVWISGQTAGKQRERHDLRFEDYALVQRILDEGVLFLEANGLNLQGFIEADGRLWKAVVKTTRDRDELFLTTFHRARPNDLRAAFREESKIERREE